MTSWKRCVLIGVAGMTLALTALSSTGEATWFRKLARPTQRRPNELLPWPSVRRWVVSREIALQISSTPTDHCTVRDTSGLSDNLSAYSRPICSANRLSHGLESSASDGLSPCDVG